MAGSSPVLAPAASSARSSHTRQFVLPSGCPPPTHALLFYAYRHVADADGAADEQAELCARLQLSGRVLVAAEGINGTLSGSAAATAAYVDALCAHPLWRMRPSDFKRSAASGASDPFSRELFVLVVPEIVASGGALSGIAVEDTGAGYLTPSEWREALLHKGDDTVVVDVRNRREFALGRFAGAVDPRTASFADFPAWVASNAALLRDKRVLMYCTGGIRCEKASALVRQAGVGAREVRHLQGGIHCYADAFGEDGLWCGKNFVFDRRGALGCSQEGPSRVVVGTCVACGCAWERMDGVARCTVCNEPVLACDACRAARREQHCDEHAPLRRCFFRRLGAFSPAQLEEHAAMLEAMLRDGALSAGRRRTVAAQAGRVRDRLAALRDGTAQPDQQEASDAPPAGEATQLWVAGAFPASAEEARAAWPCRIWPLSARPWAFIEEARGADGAFAVDVDCKVAADGYDAELGARLAPQGQPARSRFWALRRSDAGHTLLACTLQLPVSADGDEQAKQRRLHLRWLGFDIRPSDG